VNNKDFRILIFGVILAIISISCNLIQKNTFPNDVIPVSTEALNDLQNKLNTTGEQVATTGKIDVTITESELTSLVAFEIQSGGDQFIQNPQVFLRNGTIQLVADVSQNSISAKMDVKIVVTVSESGQPEFQIIEAKLGPIPLPEDIKTQIGTQILQAFSSRLANGSGKLYLDTITIADGKMVIKGEIQ
jgi:uncharacterized protein YpmS